MNAQLNTHSDLQIEPLSTRIALHPFLAGMNHTQLALLRDCAVVRHFDASQKVLGEREFANRFYLLETGKVALESEVSFGKSIALQVLGAGDLLGWSWMFPPYVWQFTARAIEPAQRCFSTRQFCGNIARKITR